jgi:predicted phage terminase large subunit-like protein
VGHPPGARTRRAAARRPLPRRGRKVAARQEVTELRPYPGAQSLFLSNPAYEVGYGGAAGSGKSFALLLELASEIDDAEYAAIAFRRTFGELKKTLIEESKRIYPGLGGVYHESDHLWRFPSGARIYFGHLQHVSDISNYKGPEFGRVIFDELTSFAEAQYRFLFTRLRRRDGKPCYMRFGTNPGDVGHEFVLKRFAPWLFPHWARELEDGTIVHCGKDEPLEGCDACAPDKPCDPHRPFIHAHEEYSGAHTEEGTRVREEKGLVPWAESNEILWVRTLDDGTEVYCDRNSHEPKCKKGCAPGRPCVVHAPLSRSFVQARISDNPTYAGTTYEARLYQQDPLTRAQMLHGDWLARIRAGLLFKRVWFGAHLAAPPTDIVVRVRYWDRAATEVSETNPDPDWTVGVLLGVTASGQFVVEDVIRERTTPGAVKELIVTTAANDPPGTIVGLEVDPGAAGKFEVAEYVTALAGFDIRCVPPWGDKVTRAKPVSVQAEAKNVKLVRGPWNAPYLAVLEGFGDPGVHDDDVDGTSGALMVLTTEMRKRHRRDGTKKRRAGRRSVPTRDEPQDEDDEAA